MSAANRRYAKSEGVTHPVEFKGSRGKPAPRLQTKMDRAIDTLRCKFGRGFGTMKKKFHPRQARQLAAAKTQAQKTWVALHGNPFNSMRALQSGRLQRCAGSSPSTRPSMTRRGN